MSAQEAIIDCVRKYLEIVVDVMDIDASKLLQYEMWEGKKTSRQKRKAFDLWKMKLEMRELGIFFEV